MGLGAHMLYLETITSPPMQMPAFERLKNCPRCLVEPHSWTFLTPPLAPGFPSLCYLWENVFRIFPLQGVGQRQLKLIQLLQSCFRLYRSGTRVVIQYTHSDAENWSFFFFFKIPLIIMFFGGISSLNWLTLWMHLCEHRRMGGKMGAGRTMGSQHPGLSLV